MFTAVDGVSFAIGAGETLALVGESGCGKTTTGKAVVQLLRRQAHVEGEALFDGHDLLRQQGEALRASRREHRSSVKTIGEYVGAATAEVVRA